MVLRGLLVSLLLFLMHVEGEREGGRSEGGKRGRQKEKTGGVDVRGKLTQLYLALP